jgi:two-component system, OmpR family, response regulator
LLSVSIQLVAGNPNLGSLLAWHLQQHGYSVYQSASITSAMTLFSQQQPKLVVLDADIAPVDAIKLCRWLFIRRRSLIMILSSLGAEQDIVNALQAGADDYLTKPFGVQEFLARVQALLRRTNFNLTPTTFLDYGILQIDLIQRQVKFKGEAIELTPQEFNLLLVLAQAEGAPMSRTELLQRGWPEQINNPRTVDTHVLSLRKKLETDPQQPHLIQTVRNVGYSFCIDAIRNLPNNALNSQTNRETSSQANSQSKIASNSQIGSQKLIGEKIGSDHSSANPANLVQHLL